ncbi:hypothetical protein VTJ49DRAFT_4600 [Mycothermus thermophilus]|uniref:BZIP domain-containing protein n=1 Tax=Humicola insolens TaxID=85995 RepID=A0ABR3V5Y7_HUMIN
MISWALKRRNSESLPDPGPSDDTTQLEGPDTPAPVFAVRALKTALFGTPAPRDRRVQVKSKETTTTATTTQHTGSHVPPTDKSPAKPPGILLTPGTGTSRRKRVSFGHDVKQGSGGATRTGNAEPPDGNFGARARPKTKLQQALETSRRGSAKESHTNERGFASQEKEAEDGWEEVEDDESDFDNDVTTDLNEPHSRSGKYWKAHFESYHTDAKTEMEKLVKYKQLAKSYAKMKDAEALELNRKLKEEQEKVQALEEKLAQLTGQGGASPSKAGGERDRMLMEEIKKQTALATEYKMQVEELEALLQDNVEEGGDGRHQRRIASPRTHRTLMEAQRELRRARSQIREMEKLQGERDRLKSDLALAEQRTSRLAEENRRLANELSQSTSRVRDLEKNLEDSKGSYEKLKEDAKARYMEAQQVLQKKNAKITELQEEVEALKKAGAEARRATRSNRAKSLDEKSMTRMSPEQTGKTNDAGGGGVRHVSISRRAAAEKRSSDSLRRISQDDATLAQARALREKLEAELGTKARPVSSVFSDRGNLQDSRSSASSGRSAHARGEEEEPNPSRTSRPARSTSATASASATGAEQPALTGLLAKSRERRHTSKESSLPGQQPRRTALPRAPSPTLSDTSPDVAQAVAQARAQTAAQRNAAADEDTDGPAAPAQETSAVWSAMNTSRAALPEHRKAAALARIQRRIAERKLMQQRLAKDKENAGPFAFSSGLESYLAHQKAPATRLFHPSSSSPFSSFSTFLPLSLSSIASTSLPFVLAAHRLICHGHVSGSHTHDPPSASLTSALAELDDAADATIPCTVARRASVAQGRALLGIWERAFAAGVAERGAAGAGIEALKGFSALLKASSAPGTTATKGVTDEDDDDPPPVSAHLAPLFGAITAVVGLSAEQAAYIFLLGHTKAVVSAAVRAGVFGPYQAQRTLAGAGVQELIGAVVEREWHTPVEEAGQTVPVLDLWVGRHEVLYSRIFNS